MPPRPGPLPISMRSPARPVEAGDDPVVRGAGSDVPFSTQIFASKFQRLLELAEPGGGIESLVDSLRAKHALCADVLSPTRFDATGQRQLEPILQAMFTARRRFSEPFLALEDGTRRQLLGELLVGVAPAHRRIQRFVEEVAADEERNVRGAARDFAAECLHFTDPERYPLMTRWVWDAATGTGALRELVAGSDGMPVLPIGADMESFAASRNWLTEQLAAQGCYRDLPYVADLVLAQTYGDYMQAMSFNVGMAAGEPAGQSDPLEFPKKLLGIDGGRPRRRSV